MRATLTLTLTPCPHPNPSPTPNQMLALDEYSQLDVVDEQLEGVRCEPSPSPSPLPYAR